MSLEYYANDRSGNNAARKILRYVKDNTPPNITYEVINGYIDTDGTVVLGVDGKIVFTITDDRQLGKFYYRIDGGEWKEIVLQGKQATVTLSL